MVPTNFTTTLPVETFTKTKTETVSVTETRTVVTVLPALTSTEISTYFETKGVFHTVTVGGGTHVETSIVTQTSTSFFTKTLPAFISTSTIFQALETDTVTVTSFEVCEPFNQFLKYINYT